MKESTESLPGFDRRETDVDYEEVGKILAQLAILNGVHPDEINETVEKIIYRIKDRLSELPGASEVQEN